MPDLSYKAVHQFWQDYPDPMIHRVISFMESMEDWTADGQPKLEAALKALGKALDDIGNIDLQQEDAFLNLITHLKMGRSLRILMGLDQAYPGAAAKVLMHAEQTTQSETDNSGVFLRRNIVFERLRLLGRIFAGDRLKLISQALESGNT